MKAIQIVKPGSPPELREVDKPTPGPGQVLLKVTAAGACHSDDFVLNMPAEGFPYPLPMTLGHEGAGVVAEIGSGVTSLTEGTAVAVYGPWGCGTCHFCSRGFENYCSRAAELGITPPGLGNEGAMADYMIVDDARHLVPLGDLDPIAAVPLTDAGLTPYHAIKPSLPKLVGGTTAVTDAAGNALFFSKRVLPYLPADAAVRQNVPRGAQGALVVVRPDQHVAARWTDATPLQWRADRGSAGRQAAPRV